MIQNENHLERPNKEMLLTIDLVMVISKSPPVIDTAEFAALMYYQINIGPLLAWYFVL